MRTNFDEAVRLKEQTRCLIGEKINFAEHTAVISNIEVREEEKEKYEVWYHVHSTQRGDFALSFDGIVAANPKIMAFADPV